jgi:DNA polymerase III epsilon subunit-like protein
LKDNDDMNKLSLKALTEFYGIENKKAHSAFADTYATYELFKKLMGLK